MHVVRVTPDALRALGPARRHAGRDRGPAGPRRLGAAPPRRARSSRRGRDVSAVPPVRPDLAPGRGLPLAPGRGGGAAQHERVALRAARRLARGAAGRAGRDLVPPLSGPPGHRAAPGRGRPARRSRPDEVFCANGSNEVLQCLLLAFGGPGPPRLVFEPTYALHSHIARITGTEVVEGAARRRLPDRPAHARRRCSRRAPRRHLPLLAQQPDRPGRAARDRRRGVRAPRPAWWSWTRPTGSSPRGRRWSCGDRRTRARRDAHLLQDVGDGRRAPGLSGGGSRRGGGVRGGGAAVPPVGADAARRPAGAAPRARDGGAGGPHRRGAGAGRRRAGRPAGRQLALRRQLHPVPAPRPRRRRRLARRCWTTPS